ncbi:M24 family metallopeptidase [Zhaonella formicivorans]|uniref:M24 family metallopeptidase n=1 Tax=Zhaonella formicivorans TaxID=2528593 RepID=UPI0010D5771D|nr:Xaa-Pro peptidase family protein [Zhaonella formicivorans]
MGVKRLHSLRQKLREVRLPALLVARPENRRYISGFTGSSGFALLTTGKSYLLTDFRYVEQAEEQASDFQVVDYGADLGAAIKNILQEEQAEELGFEEDFLTYKQYKTLEDKLQPVALKPAGGLVEQLRLQKDKGELDLLRKAAKIADAGFQHLLKLLKPGLKEVEVALELEYFMRQQGASGPAFETIVASGVRSSLPHGVASQKTLEKGDLVVLDFGAVYQGYHSDMTRTVVLGKASDEQRRIYSLVLEAQLKALDIVKSGLKCSELDDAARSYLAEQCFDKQFGHSLGHGVGLAIHEEPRVAANSTVVLAPGMAITIEPGIYIPGFGGVRIEDLVVVTEAGCESLTHSSKELIEL